MSEATRTDILARYHERIAQGTRTRLTQDEQATLVQTFISDLTQLDQAEAIAQRCRDELALLEEGYPTQTVASRLLPTYRRAIREAVEASTLPLTETTSHLVHYTKQETGEEGQAQEHWALTHLKYDNATYARLRGQTIEQNNARQDDLQPIRVDAYLATVNELLTEDDPHMLTVGIAAASGRRHTEVVARGHFEPTEHPYVLTFQGQQKKRDGDTNTTFEIVTLVPGRTILDALGRLRQHPTVQALQDITTVNDPALRTFNRQVNRAVQRRFEQSGIVPPVAGARSVSIHRLRGVYGALAIYLWCPEEQHEARFLQHYLGHILAGTAAPNSTATTHYQHYRLLDGDGQPLHAKGVLRHTIGALPDRGGESDTATLAQSATRRPTMALVDLDRLVHLTDQLGVDGSHGHRLSALLDWVQQHLPEGRQAPASPQEQPTTPIGATPAQMPPQAPERAADAPNMPITPLIPSVAEVFPVVTDQAKALSWMTDEIRSLRQRVAELEQAEAEARSLHAERSILQARIDSLSGENDTLRRRLDRFDQMRQALLAGELPTTDALVQPTAPTAQAAPAAQETADSTGAEPAPHSGPAAPATPASPTTTETEPRGGPRPGRALERATRIWEAIQTWNNTPGREHPEKVALTAATLEKRFGIHRQMAQQFTADQQAQIAAHLQAHGITSQAHNRGVPDQVWEQLKQQASEGR